MPDKTEVRRMWMSCLAAQIIGQNTIVNDDGRLTGYIICISAFSHNLKRPYKCDIKIKVITFVKCGELARQPFSVNNVHR